MTQFPIRSFFCFLSFFGLWVCLGPACHCADTPRRLPVSAGWSFPMIVSPNGRYLATTSNARTDAIELYDFKTSKTRVLTSVGVKQFYDYRMAGYGMAFSPDSETLAHGGSELGSYAAINTWDTATGHHLRTFAYTTVGQNVLYTHDGKSIVAASNDDAGKIKGSPNNTVHLWSAATGQSLQTLRGPGGMIISLALSPDGRRVAIGTITPAVLQVRDIRSGRALWTQTVARPEAEIASLAFSPDGQILARGGRYSTIYLHDAHTGVLRGTLFAPVPASLRNSAGADAARVIAYSPDGRFLAGAGPDQVVVWSARTRKLVFWPASAGQPFVFLPHSSLLAATELDVPMPHPAGAQSYSMRPPRRAGNVSLWSLK